MLFLVHDLSGVCGFFLFSFMLRCVEAGQAFFGACLGVFGAALRVFPNFMWH